MADGEFVALRDVSFAIEPGEFVSIMGASGSGKSTLLNLLGCLDRPTSGHLRLRGTDTRELDDAHLSRVRNSTIGFIFQSFNLIAPATVLTNVTLPLVYARTPRKDRNSRGMALLRAVGLEAKAASRPNQLSGGQCQRVAIARALVNRPALLLADEPTGNLDSRTGMEILRLMRAIHEHGVTIVMVTHDLKLAHFTQRILTIHDGELDADERITPEPLPQGEISLADLYPIRHDAAPGTEVTP
ncbi:MAG: ABC transporter ATP-binding protein [Candidatus Riflebacteria bacterium]|nr:ABC transporter ATP-binding protein [Candidatus Riflebacteria bacterium]